MPQRQVLAFDAGRLTGIYGAALTWGSRHRGVSERPLSSISGPRTSIPAPRLSRRPSFSLEREQSATEISLSLLGCQYRVYCRFRRTISVPCQLTDLPSSCLAPSAEWTRPQTVFLSRTDQRRDPYASQVSMMVARRIRTAAVTAKVVSKMHALDLTDCSS